MPIPVDLTKLSNAVKNDVEKKTEYNNLVPKVDNIDTINFLLKTKYEVDQILKIKSEKITDVNYLIKKTDFNSKISKVEGKIPSITGLATTSLLTAVENKIPDVSNLMKKTDFDAKLKAISDRVTSNKTKHLLVENELKILKKFDLSYFGGKNYFEGDDGTKNTLVFQVKEKYFKRKVNIGSGNSFYKYDMWKSKGLFAQNLVYAGSGNVISKLIKPAYVALNKKDEYFLQKDSEVITSGSIVNVYITYKLSLKSIGSNNPLRNCLFGVTKVTKPDDTTDPDK